MRFTFEAFGVTQIDREFGRFGEHVSDISPALETVDVMITEHLIEQFESEGAAGGDTWAALKPATLLEKQRSGYPENILQRTRVLLMSLTNPTSHPEAIRIITANMLHRGTTVPYGKFHQTGTIKMPRRRIFNFTEMLKRSILRVLQQYVVTGEV